jgi:flagellar basal-body rod modification protein FlgD
MDALQGLGGSGSTALLERERLASGQDFLKILSAQLQAQNPLEPLQETEFLGQLAQFSQLEESIETNRSLQLMNFLQDGLAAIQQMTSGASLIGKSVEFQDPSSGELRTGNVQAIRVVDGLVTLDVDGEPIPFPNLSAVLGEASD